MHTIRPCTARDEPAILEIVNSAALAYRGVIPPDRWHEPYMTQAQLHVELAAGVSFSGCEHDGVLVGVMGIQAVRDVELIRHAYVLPGHQRSGVGSALMRHLLRHRRGRMLVGTWAAASWAIDFYRRHGFELADAERAATLLRMYWDIPERQIETSVVLERLTYTQ